MYEIILTSIASMLGYLMRHYLSEKTWQKIRNAAADIVMDPNKTNDVRQAVLEAISNLEGERISKEADKIKIVLNGHRPITAPVVGEVNVPDGK